jgi:hypothetical protein
LHYIFVTNEGIAKVKYTIVRRTKREAKSTVDKQRGETLKKKEERINRGEIHNKQTERRIAKEKDKERAKSTIDKQKGEIHNNVRDKQMRRIMTVSTALWWPRLTITMPSSFALIHANNHPLSPIHSQALLLRHHLCHHNLSPALSTYHLRPSPMPCKSTPA